MAQIFDDSDIACDITNTWMSENSAKHDTIKLTNAIFKLAMDDLYEPEQWHEKISFVSSKRFTEFKEWKLTGFFKYWMMKTLSKVNNACRLVTYHIK